MAETHTAPPSPPSTTQTPPPQPAAPAPVNRPLSSLATDGGPTAVASQPAPDGEKERLRARLSEFETREATKRKAERDAKAKREANEIATLRAKLDEYEAKEKRERTLSALTEAAGGRAPRYPKLIPDDVLGSGAFDADGNLTDAGKQRAADWAQKFDGMFGDQGDAPPQTAGGATPAAMASGRSFGHQPSKFELGMYESAQVEPGSVLGADKPGAARLARMWGHNKNAGSQNWEAMVRDWKAS